MVTGKRFAFKDDFVSAVDVWVVKGRHQEMEVGRQRLHDGNLGLESAHDGGNELGCPRIGIKPGREG
jgi:hypothetical protein